MPHRKILKVELETIITSDATAGVKASVISLVGVKADAKVSPKQISRIVDLGKVENKINQKLFNIDFTNQVEVDNELRKLKFKISDLSGASVLATSVAVAKLRAKIEGVELNDFLSENLLTSNQKSNSALVITLIEAQGQRLLLVVPAGTSKNHHIGLGRQIEIGLKVFHGLGSASEKLRTSGRGQYGGYQADTVVDLSLLKLLVKVINKQKIKLGKDIYFGIDLNSSSIYDIQTKRYQLGEGPALNTEELCHWCRLLGRDYGVNLIINPLATSQWQEWGDFSVGILKTQIISVGQNLVTDNAKLETSLQSGFLESINFKVNEYLTLSELVNALERAKRAGVARILSVSPNEIEEDFMVDMAIASGCEFLDIGGPLGSEHSTKYNRLLNIAKRLNI